MLTPFQTSVAGQTAGQEGRMETRGSDDHDAGTQSGPAQRRVRVGLEELKVPDVAWPTLGVLAMAVVLWGAGLLACISGTLPLWLTVTLQAVGAFAAFTPMHDGVHGALSHRYRWLNDVVGRLCSLFFLAPYPAFRYVHLEHHKHTNHPEKDPDYWSGSGPTLLKPLRWMSQELHYYIPYFATLSQRPKAEVAESVLTLLGMYVTLGWLLAQGCGWDVFFCHVLPTRLAVMLLAYTFDYVPHRRHKVMRKDSLYQCTSRVDGVLAHKDVDLSLLLLYQTYHNIHHLYPQIPFYRYAAVWHRHEAELLKAGTPVTVLFSRDMPWF